MAIVCVRCRCDAGCSPRPTHIANDSLWPVTAATSNAGKRFTSHPMTGWCVRPTVLLINPSCYLPVSQVISPPSRGVAGRAPTRGGEILLELINRQQCRLRRYCPPDWRLPVTAAISDAGKPCASHPITWWWVRSTAFFAWPWASFS